MPLIFPKKFPSIEKKILKQKYFINLGIIGGLGQEVLSYRLKGPRLNGPKSLLPLHTSRTLLSLYRKRFFW